MWSDKGNRRAGRGYAEYLVHWSDGLRSQSRADRNTDNFGLDEEVLQAGRTMTASERAPRPRKNGMRAHTSQGATASVEPVSGWMQITAPPKPRRPSVTGWLPGTASPTTLTRHTPKKRLFVSPRVVLGGFRCSPASQRRHRGPARRRRGRNRDGTQQGRR